MNSSSCNYYYAYVSNVAAGLFDAAPAELPGLLAWRWIHPAATAPAATNAIAAAHRRRSLMSMPLLPCWRSMIVPFGFQWLRNDGGHQVALFAGTGG